MKQSSSILNRISLYWKCQLIGWLVFMAVVYIFNNLAYKDEFIEFIPFAFSILIFGLVFSHLMKITIKQFGIFKKRFAFQVISLSAISILFSFLGTFIWMVVMIKAGFWKIEGNDDSERVSDFVNEFFFNLFPVLLTLSGWLLIYFLFHYVKGVRREEELKMHYKLQMIELEAKALRAQMNPHFIFNCMNSIKALIQNDEKKRSIDYLTTFSKLIRTVFQNSDKRRISLFDEIETCRLYIQLETMRLNGKLKYNFNIDPNIDLKSVMVPALIIQPFIENAIWHGIVPKEQGAINISIKQNNDAIVCEVDDDGIGRELSKLNKPVATVIHESKGVHLSQARLNLEKILNETNASIEIIDKQENDMARGTRVVIIFNLN
ncbi:MAG TPA: histidine kinase [Chitinophagaceae bacterium]|nr:histidine kinase [Chitinophagaceae bacterium]